MATIKTDFGGFEDLARDIRRLNARDFKKKARVALMQAGALVQKNIKAKIRRPGHPFKPMIAGKANNLLSSWTVKVSADGLSARVRTSKQIYPEVMEEGRKPGQPMPPVDAIVQWLKDKRIDPYRIAKAPKKKTAQSRAKAYRSAAYVIARSIGKKGIKGRHYVFRAVRASQKGIDKIFGDLGGAIVRAFSSAGGGQ